MEKKMYMYKKKENESNIVNGNGLNAQLSEHGVWKSEMWIASGEAIEKVEEEKINERTNERA